MAGLRKILRPFTLHAAVRDVGVQPLRQRKLQRRVQIQRRAEKMIEDYAKHDLPLINICAASPATVKQER